LCTNFIIIIIGVYSQESVLGGALLRPEWPKLEAEGRERERGSWGWDSEPPSHQPAGESGKLSSGVWGGARPQMHFGRTKSAETRLVAANALSIYFFFGGGG